MVSFTSDNTAGKNIDLLKIPPFSFTIFPPFVMASLIISVKKAVFPDSGNGVMFTLLSHGIPAFNFSTSLPNFARKTSFILS